MTNKPMALPPDLSVDDPHNWNFDSVPSEALLACRYWEYERESASLRDALEKVRNAIRKLGQARWQKLPVSALPKLVALNERISEDAAEELFLCLTRSILFRLAVAFHIPFPTPWQSLSVFHPDHLSNQVSETHRFGSTYPRPTATTPSKSRQADRLNMSGTELSCVPLRPGVVRS